MPLSKENLELVQLLIDKGADPNSIDEYGNTPIVYAIEEENQELIQLLEFALIGAGERRIRDAREEFERRQAEEPERPEYVNPCEGADNNYSIIANSECEGIIDPVTQEGIPSEEGYCIGKQCHALSSIRETIDYYRYFREPNTRRFYTKEELVAAGIITEDEYVDYIASDPQAQREARGLIDEEIARDRRGKVAGGLE